MMDGTIDAVVQTTLDEPVTTTILRDLRAVGSKLVVVLFPMRYDSASVLAQLKDWDLWGPLLICLSLSILLSLGASASQGALVFSSVFLSVWFGAGIVTVNSQLLGGTISFFQAVCVLGYCVFPLCLASFLILLVRVTFGNVIAFNIIVAIISFWWAQRASVVFFSQFIQPSRRALAVFPVFFFYTFLSWMILI